MNEAINKNDEGNERYCLARTNRPLEVFQLPYDTPSILAPNLEVLWQEPLNIIIYQGCSYQIKPSNQTALTKLNWDGTKASLLDARTTMATQMDQSLDKSSFAANVDQVPTKEPLTLEDDVWVQLRTCYDPEMTINIVDLGLIYQVLITSDQLSADNKQLVTIKMTLTNPACQMGDLIIQEIKTKISHLAQVSQVNVELVFDPPWSYDMLSPQAKLELGLL